MALFAELKRRNVIRVAIAYLAVSWFLVQVVETILPVFGFSDEPIRLVIILLLIGFPIALLLSWVYELTPDGLMKEKDIHPAQSITAHTGKKLDRAIIVVLALSLVYFAVDKFVLDPARDAQREQALAEQLRNETRQKSIGDHSIAVLPFVNMSSDAEQEYFSDGISEELLNLLAKIPGLKVISRSSSFTFKGKNADIPTIAAALGVAYILEGSVRKAGNEVRITAQLIEASSDVHLWSETYDRELSNIFAIQDEISAAIVQQLTASLGLEVGELPKSLGTLNPDAHEAYLRGRHLIVQRTAPTLEGAVREFEKAIRLDAGFAPAHAELAMANLLLSAYGFSALDEATAQASPHVARALALDPALAQSHAAAGLLSYYENGGNEETNSHFEEAIRLNPNYSEAYSWLAMSYGQSSPPQPDKQIAAIQTAVRLDPLNSQALNQYIIELADRGRIEEASEALEKLASLNPRVHASTRGFVLSRGGKWGYQVLGNLDRQLLDPKSKGEPGVLRTYLAGIGLEQEALAVEGMAPSHVYTLQLLGRPEEALELAEKEFEENPETQDYLTIAQARAGQYEHAWPWYEDWWQEAPRSLNYRYLTDLIDMRRRADPDKDVSDLIDALRNPPQAADSDFSNGLANLLSGDRDDGLALIRQAVEGGFYIWLNKASLHPLYDDPGFAPILAIQEERQRAERKRVLDVVCNDNPYQSVWQPEAGTCEAFLAETE